MNIDDPCNVINGPHSLGMIHVIYFGVWKHLFILTPKLCFICIQDPNTYRSSILHINRSKSLSRIMDIYCAFSWFGFLCRHTIDGHLWSYWLGSILWGVLSCTIHGIFTSHILVLILLIWISYFLEKLLGVQSFQNLYPIHHTMYQQAQISDELSAICFTIFCPTGTWCNFTSRINFSREYHPQRTRFRM